MRELERDSVADDPTRRPPSGRAPRTLAIVGAGRLGTELAAALGDDSPPLPDGPWRVTGPHGRGYAATGDSAVLLCVPDREISTAAGLISPGPLVGHCSGACRLDALKPHEAFSLHPLMTVVPGRTRLVGAGAAVAGASPRATAFACRLAQALGMRPIAIAEDERAAYHAAASIASNFLITLETAAERLAASAGVKRELLGPLVRATVENWIEVGGKRALTGPVARGDHATVAAQRVAVAERVPDLLPLFDALTDATRELAAAPTKFDPATAKSELHPLPERTAA
jgi:predicted short-subunit dehydrogenase-like oxidoreductase (DUF2520 family)